MTNSPQTPPFVKRFEFLRGRLRRTDAAARTAWILAAALAAAAGLTALDYFYEIPWIVRVVGMIATLATAAFAMAALTLRALWRWSRSNTAVEMESAFPELGQSVRTSIQYGTAPAASESGTAKRLVEALHVSTERRAEPLGLETMLPLPQLIGALATGFALAGIAIGATTVDREWRLAAMRAFGVDRPYTETVVTPGDVRIDEGQPLDIRVEVAGRVHRETLLKTRPLNGDWTVTTMATSKRDDRRTSMPDGRPVQEFTAKLSSLKAPIEYQIVVGGVESPVYTARVRYPLKIKTIEGEVVPPAYTAQPPAVQSGGDLDVLEGSKVRVVVTLDRPLADAKVEIAPAIRAVATKSEPASAESAKSDPASSESLPSTESTGAESPTVADVVREGDSFSFALEPSESIVYTIGATGDDGAALKPTTFRVRVRRDQPPHVEMTEPDDRAESHALAEVMMRMRARDDYGLSRSGIMFQVNNQDEYPLAVDDPTEVAAAAEALDQVAQGGPIAPKTQAILERVLPLEVFKLSHTDSVMYYAYAEDNRPNAPQRSETDMRFLDIRPFRRNFKIAEPMPNDPNAPPPRRTMALEELITRERLALNRTLAMQRRNVRGQSTDLNSVDSLVTWQTETAEGAQGFADFLQSRGFDRTELLAEAERSMLASVDSLSSGAFDTAQLQIRDALKYLIEMRDLLDIFINTQTPQQRQELQQYDRAMIQKLRYPKADKKQMAKQIVRRAQQLAQRQRQVAQSAAQGMTSTDQENPFSGEAASRRTSTEPSAGAEKSKQEPMEPEEPSAEEKPGGSQQEEPKTEEGQDKPDPTKEEEAGVDPDKQRQLQDTQNDIAIESRMIESVVADMPEATDQAKERSQDAAASAEDAADKMDANERQAAAKAAAEAADRMEELANNLQGLLSPDIADRVAAARDLAGALARREEKIADAAGKAEAAAEKKAGAGDEPGENKPTGGMSREEKAATESEANRVAAAVQTLRDILTAGAKIDDPADAKAAKALAGILADTKISETAAKAQGVGALVRNERFDDARAQAGAAADQLQAASQKLDALYRSLVAPKIQELTNLEKMLSDRQDELDSWKSAADVAQWHEKMREALEKMEDVGFDPEGAQEMERAIAGAGLQDPTAAGVAGLARDRKGRYAAPSAYAGWLRARTIALRTTIAELTLAEMAGAQDEPSPPQYEAMIRRYYEVLSKSSVSQP